ncbi:MAG: hypothetical protein ACQR33_02760 [Candidatus Saccharibacteria bacterium]
MDLERVSSAPSGAGYEPDRVPEGWRCEWPAEYLLPYEQVHNRVEGTMPETLYQRHLEVASLWRQMVSGTITATAECLERLPRSTKDASYGAHDYFASTTTESPVRSQHLLIGRPMVPSYATIIRVLGSPKPGRVNPLRISSELGATPDYIKMSWQPRARARVQDILAELGAAPILGAIVGEVGDRKLIGQSRHEINLGLGIVRCPSPKRLLHRRPLNVHHPILGLPFDMRGNFRLNTAGTLTPTYARENEHGRVTIPEFLALGQSILALLDIPQARNFMPVDPTLSREIAWKNLNIPPIKGRA